MSILPRKDLVAAVTIPPDVKIAPEEIGGTIPREHFEGVIKLNRWHQIKIVAEASDFIFHFGGNLVSKYKDETAGPGTVSFETLSEMLVHLDDVAITGPHIPNIRGAHSIHPDGHLTTTWGEIKNSSRR